MTASASLAFHLAEEMASGRRDRLVSGEFGPNASPETVRECLLAYYVLRDAAAAERAALWAQRASMADRVALARVAEEIDHAIAKARRFLSRVARRGGRGLPPPARLQ